ncbi:MAG: type II secretion system protein [Parcubacteria group bacterium]|jgi:prepilin-type N-terminal cleavage/methylation domain-containing protein
MRKGSGFTLIEILVAMAIVAILASFILVSMSAYRSKARSAKALSQLSSAIPSMMSCWINSGAVSAPSSGDDICSLASTYGKWPQTEGDLDSYSYGGTITDSASWFITLTSDSGNDGRRICCNGAMNSCKIQSYVSGSWDESCSVGSPAY